MIVFVAPLMQCKGQQNNFVDNPWKCCLTIDFVSNTPLNGILEDSSITHIYKKCYTLVFAVWIEYQGQSNNFVLGCSASCTKWINY